jgi:hypothetical protein
MEKDGTITSGLLGRQASEKLHKNEGAAMVLYFTGTGNSRYLAQRIAEGLEMPLYNLNACIQAGDTAPVSL